ncbi:phage/plasmid primase, P4 family [Pseudoclavibacter sp. JSM 162008]|uniref:phage/plasmid primase, P4 family n=1 Tax=Pseudoclavibacter sp. JSM 162008 TaxID=3229855 RepID=UPI0035248D21
MADSLLHTAATAWAAGMSVVPTRPDQTKRPLGDWKQHQTDRADIAQLQAWFTDDHAGGLGIITGTVSGRLEMLEIEGRALTQLGTIGEVARNTIPDVWSRVNSGWLEESPSGGLHWMYRLADDTTDMPGNTKIARNADKEVLAETRGEGGFFVAAPSGAHLHAAGKPWTLVAGGPTSVPTLTTSERASLHAILHAVLDETPAPAPTLAATWKDQPRTQADGDITPGDDYEQKVPWTDILTPHGWTVAFVHGHTTYWTRPGKDDRSVSATTGHAEDRDRLFVFSSSTDFDTEEPYTKFGAYAHLNHHGDHSAAARQLAADGYGHRAERTIPAAPAPTATTADGTAPAGNLAAVAELRPAKITGSSDQLTDWGNADLTLQRHRGRIVYIPDAKRWAAWDGARWEWGPDDAPALQAVLDTVRQIPEDQPALATHRKRSLGSRALGSAVTILRTMPELRVPAGDFDAHPLQLNTPDGIVDLVTGATTDGLPLLYHSKITAAGPADAAPKWAAFIDWAMGGDQELVAYLRRLVGISLLGEVREHVLPFCYGGGANGKSVFLEVLGAVLGDYATEAPANLLLAGPDRHPTELAALQGRRLVVMSEINEGARFDEAKLKALTGGDTIAARFMRGDFFAFKPSHTLWLAANHKPRVAAGGHGFWRRLRLIPFEQTIAAADRDENLAHDLVQQEAAGILAWALEGLADYLTNGLNDPARVLAATKAYSDEEDHLGRFADERLHIGGGDHVRTPTSDITNAYKKWCRAEGEEQMTTTAFGRELKARFGIETVRPGGRKKYVGVTLLADPDEETADDNPRLAPHWDRS